MEKFTLNNATITHMKWWNGKDWITVPEGAWDSPAPKKEPETLRIALYKDYDKAANVALKLMDMESSTVHDVLEDGVGNWWVVRYL